MEEFFEVNKLSSCLSKVSSILTDGAPSMVGKEKGFVTRFNDIHPHIFRNHCIIHQAVLCCKLSSRDNQIMLRVMKPINFLRSKSSLRHPQLRLHNDVRWLSKGAVHTRL